MITLFKTSNFINLQMLSYFVYFYNKEIEDFLYIFY
ncbi:hypothetical protein EV143_101637 [Flavobacterium chryseum]|uniref:Uncharacterized protein n=1 Tax=Flavobacterium circumlabens TaxID=2133765 RepID=A0ABY2AWZ6_9FLAO|nr:hypothetical protein EV142_108146 [Flavobacterium circumlabens]TDO84191.1 hypothetical protein EV143_101637 [Flavobacterium sp. P3160]